MRAGSGSHKSTRLQHLRGRCTCHTGAQRRQFHRLECDHVYANRARSAVGHWSRERRPNGCATSPCETAAQRAERRAASLASWSTGRSLEPHRAVPHKWCDLGAKPATNWFLRSCQTGRPEPVGSLDRGCRRQSRRSSHAMRGMGLVLQPLLCGCRRDLPGGKLWSRAVRRDLWLRHPAGVPHRGSENSARWQSGT